MVCSPKLLSGHSRIRKPADLVRFPLLHFDDRKDWSKWFELSGVPDGERSRGPVLNRASMVIDAAVDGQGVALARTTLAAWDLLNGRLVGPFTEALRLSKTYWIVCPKATAALPKIRKFRDWLLAEAAADGRRLKALRPGLIAGAVHRRVGMTATTPITKSRAPVSRSRPRLTRFIEPPSRASSAVM